MESLRQGIVTKALKGLKEQKGEKLKSSLWEASLSLPRLIGKWYHLEVTMAKVATNTAETQEARAAC